MILRPPRSTRTATLFPSPPLVRAAGVANPQAEFEPIPGAGPPVLDAELDDLTAPIEQRKWVIRRVALVAKVSELIAPPGMGKSSLALLLAVATATGRGDLVGFAEIGCAPSEHQ